MNFKSIAERFGGKIPNFEITNRTIVSDLTSTRKQHANGSGNFLSIFKGGDQFTAGTSSHGDVLDPVYIVHREIYAEWKKSTNKAEFCAAYEEYSEQLIYAPR